jgi:hypothetical protein
MVRDERYPRSLRRAGNGGFSAPFAYCARGLFGNDSGKYHDVGGDHPHGYERRGESRFRRSAVAENPAGDVERAISRLLARLPVAEFLRQIAEHVSQFTHRRCKRPSFGRSGGDGGAREDEATAAEQIEMIGALLLAHDRPYLRPPDCRSPGELTNWNTAHADERPKKRTGQQIVARRDALARRGDE